MRALSVQASGRGESRELKVNSHKGGVTKRTPHTQRTLVPISTQPLLHSPSVTGHIAALDNILHMLSDCKRLLYVEACNIILST